MKTLKHLEGGGWGSSIEKYISQELVRCTCGINLKRYNQGEENVHELIKVGVLGSY